MPGPRPFRKFVPVLLWAALGAVFLSAVATAAVAAVPDYLAAEDPNAGFVYATVTWPDGTARTGFLRWEDEEAFWDDLFHSGQRDLPWLKYADQDKLRAERRQRFFQEHGLLGRLMYALHEDDQDAVGWRIFLAQLGDIAAIEIHKGHDDFVVTCDGSRFEIGGYANDAGSDLLLYAGDAEPELIEWNDLARIAFAQAPAELPPYARRMYGSVESGEGVFTGFIQWDKSECLSSDTLDGQQGGRDVDVPLGDILSITRSDRGSCEVTRRDGTLLALSGTNDVNNGNRGIVVQDPTLGRVSIPWKRFVKLTFSDADRSGFGRDRFGQSAPLQGTVTPVEGPAQGGRLVFDLDKAWQWNILSGSWHDLDFDVPMVLVRVIERRDDESCRVTLAGGRILELSGSTETGPLNAGLLVFVDGAKQPVHVPWRQVRSVEFRSGP